MPKTYDETKLPKWVQEEFTRYRYEIENLKRKLSRVQQAWEKDNTALADAVHAMQNGTTADFLKKVYGEG